MSYTAAQKCCWICVLTIERSTRKWEVVFVAPGSPDKWIRVPKAGSVAIAVGDVEKEEPLDPKTLPEGEPEIEIESLIIPAVKGLHSSYVEAAERK